MFISSAYAQTGSGGTGGGLEAFIPLILIFAVFYFLLIRPQQKKVKQHRETLAAIRRGDRVVTGGGIIGSVTKVDNEYEVTVEIAKEVKVKVRRDLISAVVSKTEPQVGTKPQAANEDKPQGGLLASLFGAGQKPAQHDNASKIKEKGVSNGKSKSKANSDDVQSERSIKKKID